MSKKAAESINALVIELMVGKAAYCKTLEEGRLLGKTMVRRTIRLLFWKYIFRQHILKIWRREGSWEILLYGKKLLGNSLENTFSNRTF